MQTMTKTQILIKAIEISAKLTIATIRLSAQLVKWAYRAYQASQQATSAAQGDSPTSDSQPVESKYAISLEAARRSEIQNLETLSQVHYRLSQLVDEAQGQNAVVTPRARKYAITGAIIRNEPVHAYTFTFLGLRDGNTASETIEVYVSNGGLL